MQFFLLDPDVPSEQDASGRSFRHWLVTNIPGTDIARGSTIRPYIGPGALPNTGTVSDIRKRNNAHVPIYSQIRIYESGEGFRKILSLTMTSCICYNSSGRERAGSGIFVQHIFFGT